MTTELTGDQFLRPGRGEPPLPPELAERSEVVQLLRRSPLGQGLSSSELDEVARRLTHRLVPSGQVLLRQDEPGDRLFVVARGRVRLTIERADYHFHDYLGRGSHFGELAMLTDGPSFGTAVAVMDSELLELDRDGFQQLLGRIPGFSANLSRTLGQRMRWVTSGRRQRERPAVVALVHATLRTQGLLFPLLRELSDRGESIEVLTDRAEVWPTEGRYLVERIPARLEGSRRAEAIHQRMSQVLEHHSRILLDVTQRSIEEELRGLLLQCEEILWLLDPDFVETSCGNLARLLADEPSLAPRTRVVWILPCGEKVAPPLPVDLPLTHPSLKVVLGDQPRNLTWPERRTIERLARHLRGIRIGMALSGGGARGMAHLGVLRALDRAEISVDHLAATSSGALTGMAYAAGWDADDALREFLKKLGTPRWLRKIPGAGHGYLWANFRFDRWDALLRPYLGTATLEQMQVPISIMTVDLISGRLVVRERGDAIHAILESINLPIISRPILRDGMALVDGGVLNNLPADVLVQRGADLVIGVDVMSRLPQRFAGNHPGMPLAEMRRPKLAETVLRIIEVQDHGFTSARSQLVDVMITPDTPKFDFTDFNRSQELAEVGQAAAEEQIPRIRERIADLERG